jgi:DNA-binding NtrC family response regulator
MPDYSFTSIKAISMPADFSILLVYDQDEPVCGVERIFQLNGINMRRVRNCVEAREVLREAAAPCVVVTDLALPDGDWADVLRAANDATAKAAVIVASRILDIRLYLDVLDSGAHDFVVPPFSASDLAYIIRTAIQTGRSFLSQSLGSDKAPAGPDYFRTSESSRTEIVDSIPPQMRRSSHEHTSPSPTRRSR